MKVKVISSMRYNGNGNSNERVGLVGKGLTFDTGGYSLKPSSSMDTMKSDMGGAAAVIGTMQALAKNKVEKNVVAVVAACENAVSGGSYKPGDIYHEKNRYYGWYIRPNSRRTFNDSGSCLG